MAKKETIKKTELQKAKDLVKKLSEELIELKLRRQKAIEKLRELKK